VSSDGIVLVWFIKYVTTITINSLRTGNQIDN